MSKVLGRLAKEFDASFSAEREEELSFAAFLCGSQVGLRYYLGRIAKRNLFRRSDAEVRRTMVAFVATMTSKRGAVLAAGPLAGWTMATLLLRHEFENQTVGKSAVPRRRAAIIRAFLTDPSMTNAKLARAANTTEKQIARDPDVRVLRHLAISER
jgi:hypothetical protein